jgi:choline dehydrogenase-like flavoprotein
LVTLRECFTFPGFSYHAGWLASHFEYDALGQVTGLEAVSLDQGDRRGFTADRFVLAAGALASSKLVLDSIFRRTGRIERLGGLMDNRQIHLPFLLPAMIGQPLERAAYQFHHLAFGLTEAAAEEYVHGQITTLKAASVHPIVQSLPLDSLGALGVFRAVRPALGLANINLHDRRRPESALTIRPLEGEGGGGAGDRTELVAEYRDDPAEAGQIARAVRRTGAALRRLGAVIPPGMTRVLPKGASVHYAGTLPMASSATPLGATPEGRSWDFPNLYFADGATFPFLPAKNLTFTLMANAVRIARAMDT